MTSNMRRSFLLALLSLPACLGGGGDDVPFPIDAPRNDASTIDRPMSMLASIDGTFLVAMRAGFEPANTPEFYLQMIVTWDLDPDVLRLDGSYVPLCVHPSCNGVRGELPPAIVDLGRAVTSAGEFAQPVRGQLAGAANPFSGTDQPIDATLEALIFSPDLVCGTVRGTFAGLNLAGSTFAAIRVTDTTPANLPAPVAACS